ncbi:MAG: DUF1697 domain-containing protein [Longimicrobiales bacterium]|nr:DUF1697 domain-containing protein [Longimicrobiales bacterium]
MTTWVALLRGVNVGGKHRLPMRDLVAIFGDAGCADATSYIQSGNVVFRADRETASRVPTAVEEAVADRFGFRAPIMLRPAEELAKVARENPFARAGEDVATLHVAFLAGLPSADRVASLDPDRSPPDEFAVRGSHVYLRCPGGYGRTRLTSQYFDSRLATTSTVRNWRTVLALLEMTARP